MRKLTAEEIDIARAIHSLRPRIDAAFALRKRRPSLTATALVNAVPKLVEWLRTRGSPLDADALGQMIVAPGSREDGVTYQVIAKLPNVRKTPRGLATLYRRWIAEMPRDRRIATPPRTASASRSARR